ncbi:hypothetical protein N7G274_000997 [Stereocaulon virgatum]|uniref:AB hydrolase-1 domain-containing protein n=1 Tax=Stereocaulon virgatum TaxID=373712 RepID=A0ABR4AMK6_9LECA
MMNPPKAIPSPRDTLLPFLSEAQAAALPYSPNLLPGARDVDTPYGVMRVYEWGPASGRKVLLVHGDTTPGPMLGPIATALAQKDCRVMVIDVWGRGYSDSPKGVHYDIRLFSMQLLFATASSSLSWTGSASGGFSIIAFSLGCAITMSFASKFPYLINAIILLAPAGLLRRMPDGYGSIFFRYPWLVPFTYIRKLVGNILEVNLASLPIKPAGSDGVNLTALDASLRSQSTEIESLDVPAIVQWQFDNHQGFVHSFVNTIKHRSLMHQSSEWRNICNIIKGESSGMPGAALPSKIYNSKILVILGDADGIVVAKEVSEDLEQMLGPEHVEFRTVPGGHGFPVPSHAEVIKHILEFWGLDVVN